MGRLLSPTTLLTLTLLFLSMLTDAHAETRSRVYSSGTWTLDRVDGLVVKDGTSVGTFDDMCVVESANAEAKLSLAMNASDSLVPAEFRQNVYLQLSSPSWNFKFLEGSLYLISEGVFGAGNAWYYGDTIAFTLLDGGHPDLAEFVKTAGSAMTVVSPDGATQQADGFMIAVDVDGRVIAKIEARGLKEVYQKLLECSGHDHQKRLSRAAQKRLERLRTQGDAYTKNGQFGRAIEIYTKALAIDPSDATIYRWRATAYDDSGNYERAIEDYTKALTIKPDYQSALSWRAMAYRHLGQSDAAVTDFTKAIALEPDDEFNYTWRGMTYGDLKKWDVAIADFTRAIALEPNDAFNHKWRGHAYRNLGDYEKALADLARSIELEPSAFAYSQRGQVYDAMKHPEQAIIEYTKAIEITPASEREGYLFNRALTYDDLKKYELALADLTVAIKLSPNDPLNYKWRGIIRRKTGDFDAGLKDLNRAIDLNPDADTYYHRGKLYEEMGKQDLAIADASRSIVIAPDVFHYRRRASAYEVIGRYDLALQDCNMAFLINPYDSGGYLCRSRIYFATDKLQDAKKDLDQALTLDPKFAVAYRARALVEFYSGDTARAIDDLRKAVELEPSDSYGVMWLEIASRRGGTSDVLAGSVSNLDMLEWPAPLVELMMDRTTLEAVLRAARSSNPRFDRVRRCDASFYGGMWLLLNDSEGEAMKLLRYAFDNCPHNFLFEWLPARFELEPLEDTNKR